MRVLAQLALLISLTASPLRGEDEAPPKRIPEKALKVLKSAETIELFLLDPEPIERKKPEVEVLDEWAVVGKTIVKEVAVREKVVTAIEQGTTEPGLEPAKCFDPHHGVRATHEGVTVELVICFACSQMYVYVDGKKDSGTLISKSPAQILNKILKEGGAFPKPES